ncbi:uncharacterized protein C05D11.1-like [Neocloeon triangulifer]|uniref:uncharacterized protein C05D11.1-like n=1 Tax=Neocloeon triangulifer TaxID=2078957 RepID=UPI00286F9871|nr:uncharacterized protein C05D11.1-like [Neocloeon triangulifer]
MAPVDGSAQNVSPGFAFKLVCEGQANGLVDVKKYRSARTGLTVVLADVDGPVVNGYFCLATEAHDDDGLPHTLEHLIFLGSEQYPYKGVLDLLANRCLASGTNAWTDTDHTCYTMTTVGSEGFLSLMPIYLDHILYPTLSDEGFITEVHHISGDGQDNGVVYCEMQGRENSGESLCHLNMLRALFPNCGYCSETGGIMKNLRTSTDNIKVRKFHKDFYRPENLTLIVTGKVKAEQVFSALSDMEEKICSKGDRGAFTRPWQSEVQPLAKSVEQLVPYPCDEEDCGMVSIAWRGPSAVTDLVNVAACSIIMKYLTDTAVSPLQRDLVEIKDPYASRVCYSMIENSIAALFIIFENVPIDKVDKVKGKVDEILEQIISGKEAIDATRLCSVINRQILETLSHLETNPHDTIAFMAIGDMLYGQNQKDFQQRLNTVQDLRKLLEEPNSFWIDLLRKYFGADAPSVLIKGRPSIELQVKMAEEEEERVKQQCALLGESGLKGKADALMAAIEHNERPPPDEMLTSVPIPGTGGINFHTIESFTSNNTEVSHPNFSDITSPGVTTYLLNIKSNFVYMFALMDTNSLPANLRSYLPLLLETIIESPVERDGVVVPYETIVSELESDTISASTRVGLEVCSRFSCGPFGQTALLLLQLEPGKYARCVKWMQEILYGTQLTTERLSVVATKMINDVAQAKRNGNGIAIDILKSMLFCKESNQYCSSMLRQHRVLTELSSALEAGGDGAKKILEQLNQLREEITKPENLSVMVAANFEALEQADQPWKEFLPSRLEASLKPLHVTCDAELISECQGQRGSIVGLGCVESSFLKHCCPGLKGYKHEDLPALLVFTQYLTQLEGPLWKQVRGQGLAYGYNMFPQPNEGRLYFTIFKATNTLAAFVESKAIVEAQLKPDAVWDETLFDSARSSLVFEIVEREKSVGDAVVHSLLSFFKGVPLDYNKELVQKVSKVTTDDLRRVGAKYVAPLFVPGSGHTSIVCHSSKVEEIATAFNDLGFSIKISSSLEESPLA